MYGVVYALIYGLLFTWLLLVAPGIFAGGLTHRLKVRKTFPNEGMTLSAKNSLTLLLFDHCARLILLKKVGGGYIFIHRMLLEYFAELIPTPRKLRTAQLLRRASEALPQSRMTE